MKLTQTAAERWPPPERGEAHVADTGQPGLSLRVRASGARTWQVLYRTGGRETPLRRMYLGAVEKISLKPARDLARRVRAIPSLRVAQATAFCQRIVKRDVDTSRPGPITALDPSRTFAPDFCTGQHIDSTQADGWCGILAGELMAHR